MHKLIMTLAIAVGFNGILYTQSWELIFEAPEGIDVIFDIQQIEDSIIWAVGGGLGNPFIAVSHDDGQSWVDQASSIPNAHLFSRITNIHFFDIDTGVLSVSGGPDGMFFTEDGGQSWEPATVDFQDFEPFAPSGIQDMVFGNGQEGWALKFSSPAAVLHTTDGGQSWVVNRRDGVDTFRDIAYINGDTLVIVDSDHLEYSHDGGENWNEVEDNLWQVVFSAFFMDRQHGWWAGRVNQVHQTFDGGVTWDTSFVTGSNQPSLYKSRHVHFHNDTLGWVILDVSSQEPSLEGVYVNTDGGEKWKQQNPAIGTPFSMEVYGDSLAFVGTAEIFDNRGKVYRYRKRPASCLQAGSISVADSNSLYPLLSWQQATGAYDGYYLQLGSTPSGQDVLPRTDVGLDTFYQVSTPLPDGVELYATVLPYNHILGAAEGCGSTAFTTPACPPPIAVDTGYCKGSSLLWVDSLITSPGPYTFADTLSSGCVQETQLQVQQYDNPSSSIDTAYCAGTTFYWQDSLLAGPGNYTFQYASAQGCDSTVLLRLEEWPAPTLRIDTFICEGSSYTGQDTLISDAGTYSFHYSTILGCDSTVQLFLEERLNKYIEIDTALTVGELYDGQAYEGDTTLVYNLTAANGCDSIVTVHIDVVTSTYQPQQAQPLRVQPNPSSDYFTILALPQAAAPVRVQVFDANGRLLLEKTVDISSDWRFSAESWPVGLYLLRAQMANRFYTVRLFKQ